MADAQKVEIGFEGGQVVAVRLSEDELKDLRKQLEKGGWHDVETEDGVLSVYLGKVAFLRIDSGDHRVGFSLGPTDAPPQAARRRRAWRRLAPPSGGARTPPPAPTASASGSKAPHPIITRERLLLRAAPAARGAACWRSGRAPATTRSTWPSGSARGHGSRSSTSSRSSSTTPWAAPRERGLDNVVPTQGDATALPYEDGSIDAVVLDRRARRDPRPRRRPARDPPGAEARRPPGRRRALRRPPLHDPGRACAARAPRPGLAYEEHSGNWFGYVARLTPRAAVGRLAADRLAGDVLEAGPVALGEVAGRPSTWRPG